MSIIKDFLQFRRFIKAASERYINIQNASDFFNDSFWTSLTAAQNGRRGKVTGNIQSQLDAFWGDVYRCADIRSKVCASVPWGLYRAVGRNSTRKELFRLTQCKTVSAEKKDYLFGKASLRYHLKSADDIEEITNHPFSKILYNVNSFQNQSNLKYLTTCYQDLTGNAYWYVLLSQAGVPAEIQLLYPQSITPIYDDSGNLVQYKYTANKTEVILDAKQVIHFMYNNPVNMNLGLSPVAASCDTINEQVKMNELLSYLLETKLVQDVFLRNKGAKMNEDAKKSLKQQWQEYVNGRNKSVPVFEGDLEPVPLTQSLRDLPFLANKKFDREQIYGIFGIPIAFATMESSNRSTIDIASDRVFMGYTISPMLTAIEETINQSLISKYYSEDIFIAYDDCVPEDKEYMLNERKTALAGMPYRLINEVRMEDGLPPVDGGDVLYAPGGMPVGSKITNPEEIETIVDKIIKRVKEKIYVTQ